MEKNKSHKKRMFRLGGAGFIVLVLAVVSFLIYNDNAAAYTLGTSTGIVTNKPDRVDATYYLNVSGNVHTNFINQHVISGYITNISKHTNYKDVELNVRFLDSQDKELGSKVYLIDISIPSGDTHPYKLRTNSPERTKTVKWEVVNARAYE